MFTVGPKIYFHLNNTDSVQVDFVDAVLYFEPWKADSMVTTLPKYPDIEVLTPQALLVQKIITATERSFPDPRTERLKISNDIVDFSFLATLCDLEGYLLSSTHTGCFHGNSTTTLKSFYELMMKTGGDNDGIISWNNVVLRSGLGEEWKLGEGMV